MKHILLPALLCLAALQVFGQGGKQISPSNLSPDKAVNLNIRPWFTPKTAWNENPFGLSAPDVQMLSVVPGVKITMGNEGLPIFFEGATSNETVEERTAAPAALSYLESLKPAGIMDPATEFFVKKVQTDERGNFHVRFQQQYKGIPVFGAELIAHTKNGVFTSAAGRYASTPHLQSVQPYIDAAAAIQKVVQSIGTDKVKKEWSADELELVGGAQFHSELVIYRVKEKNNAAYLAWNIDAYANLISRSTFFVDAQTGEILHHFKTACDIAGNHKTHSDCRETAAAVQSDVQPTAILAPPPPPVMASGVDLEGITRTFGAWQHTNGKRYLVDATKPMFNGNAASVPLGVMQGVIVTRDQSNVGNGPLTHITSNSDVFNNPNAVSAHYNTGLCYEYYHNTFNRNSINGSGGTINVVVNVPEDGHPMDNAYWSGNSMYWGNGDQVFSPLAKSLDVTGHEMTHGVVQETAGLIYESESGALNESFADIFAVMIDRDDWAIGDGIMLPGTGATGYLRDFVDPHNGDDDWYQPSHYSERATGEEDNGGVHANSGITNHAFYLIASNPTVGKEIAEQIYYYVLRDRLTASSKFIDLRLAVIAEAAEFYNQEIADIAAAAFDEVGITTGAPHAAAASLSPGTGLDYIISVTHDGQYLDLSASDGTLLTTVYEDGVLDKPSVTDNGEQIVFVNNAHQIVGVEIAYNDGSIQYNTGIVSEDTTWRNAAISKDGRFLAGLTTLNDNKVIIFDLANPTGPEPREYFLVNPTNVQGVEWVDNVAYADVIEFDYSGTHLIYDAFSILENAEGEDISNWDIGLLEFWKDGQYAPNDTPNIRKLISQLPERVGVADPAFSKNSPNLIAFDYYVQLPEGGTEYLTYVADVETGDNGPVVSNGLELGYPCFTTKDDKVLFQDKSLIGGTNLRLQKLAPDTNAPQGNPGNIILGHKWGTWLNNGSRVLTTGAHTAQQKELALSVSPNPTGGTARITLDATHAAEAQVIVSNLLGQSLQHRLVSLSAGENQVDLNLESLPTGTYFVRISAGNMQGGVKVVKE